MPGVIPDQQKHSAYSESDCQRPQVTASGKP